MLPLWGIDSIYCWESGLGSCIYTPAPQYTFLKIASDEIIFQLDLHLSAQPSPGYAVFSLYTGVEKRGAEEIQQIKVEINILCRGWILLPRSWFSTERCNLNSVFLYSHDSNLLDRSWMN